MAERPTGERPARTYVIELPFPSDPTDPEQIKARAEACGFCHGEPVGDAAGWLDGKPRPPAPCPRCGVTSFDREAPDAG